MPQHLFPLKCWPIQNFKQLIERIIQSGTSVVLVGASGEIETEELVGHLGDATIFYRKDFTILQSAALLEMANAVIANDTSIVHLAEAMGTPSIALFGPTVKEFGYAPMLEQSRLIETDLALRCRPCSRTGKGTCKNRSADLYVFDFYSESLDAAQLLLPKVEPSALLSSDSFDSILTFTTMISIKMPCNFKLRQICWIFFYSSFRHVQKRQAYQIFQPAEIDTSDIRRIAIGVFEIGVVQENIAVERAGDWTKKSAQLTDEECQILSRNIGTLHYQSINQGPF